MFGQLQSQLQITHPNNFDTLSLERNSSGLGHIPGNSSQFVHLRQLRIFKYAGDERTTLLAGGAEYRQ